MAAANSGSVGRGRDMTDKPGCGTTVGHGAVCQAGWLCDGCEYKYKALDLEAELEGVKQKLKESEAEKATGWEENKKMKARLEAIARVTISDDIHAIARGQADRKVQAILGGF
jgi:hypothetical protein